MKYIIILGDGMADESIEQLGNQTPLEYAKTPTMDWLAKHGEIGLAYTIPEGMNPGSDTANLAVLGYNPRKYYTGRSPLEALSIGVDMKKTDIAIRCNMVTVSEDDLPYKEKTILDHSAGEITTKEAAILMKVVKEQFETDVFQYYVGTSYRHLTIWNKGSKVDLIPPHDILGKVIADYLPVESKLKEIMEQSYLILNHHPVNVERAKRGLNKANSLWFWGAGTKPILDSFEEKNQKKGAVISAVDLLKGIAVGASMENIIVEGADGTLHTNYEGKADAAVKTLVDDNNDFVYLHVEAPDEMGHQGSIENKVKAIEFLDERIIKRVKEQLEEKKIDYRMLILPDHPTPIHCRTHTSNPVPYLLYDSTNPLEKQWNYNEKEAMLSGNVIREGYTLVRYLFK